MEVNGTRNYLFTDILLNIKMVKLNLFNSEGIVKWAYYQKKRVEYPFKTTYLPKLSV